MRNQVQLSAEEAIQNTKIAAARVHIERCNKRIKIFKIFGGRLKWNLVQHINDIFLIACAITNLSAPILSNDRFLPYIVHVIYLYNTMKNKYDLLV